MVSTRKKKQQKERLFSELSERDTDFMIGQSNQDEQTESRGSMTCRGTSSEKTSNLTQVKYPQVDVHTLKEILLVKYEVKWIMW